MKPVAIFRHIPWEGAGYFSEFLARHEVPSQLIAIDRNEPIPSNPCQFSGLVFMGGSMSVNDPLPWVAQSLELIRRAVDANIPVLGHCLGGQLMAKALGATVKANPVKEIGWGVAEVSDNPTARDWLGVISEFTAFHWHGETFDLPSNAVHILKSSCCENQACVINDKHLALQCHVEMTEKMILDWCQEGEAEIDAARTSPCVQSPAAMQTEMNKRLDALHRVADQLYTRWLAGLSRS